MSYTRRQFATDVLKALGNNKPDKYVVSFVVAWSIWETSVGQSAAYNLLNTTMPMSGATDYNKIGVKNYTSYTQGIEATVKTLNNGLYDALSEALRTNQVGKLSPGTDRAIEQNLNTWSGGQGYFKTIVATANRVHNDVDRRGYDVFGGKSQTIESTGERKLLPLTGGIDIGRGIDVGPNDSVSEILQDVDAILALTNPFDVPNAPKATIFGTEITDPMQWLSEVGLNFGENMTALVLRLIVLMLGVIVFWKIIKVIFQIDPFGQILGGGS